MKKIVFVALMALCGVSFSFGDSMADCVSDCRSSSVSPLLRKQKTVDETKCIGDCESKDQEVPLHENVQGQSDGYSRQKVNPAAEEPAR